MWRDKRHFVVTSRVLVNPETMYLEGLDSAETHFAWLGITYYANGRMVRINMLRIG